MTYVQPPPITTGSVVKAATVSQALRFNMDSALHRLAYKPSDTSRTNNTLADDPDLTVNFLGGELWYLEMHLVHHGDSALSHLLVQWVCPTDAQFRGQSYGLWYDATNYLVRNQTYDPSAGDGLFQNQDGWYDSSTVRSNTYRGLLRTVTAGTFKLQWSQVTTNATPTVLEQTSSIMGAKIGADPGPFVVA